MQFTQYLCKSTKLQKDCNITTNLDKQLVFWQFISFEDLRNLLRIFFFKYRNSALGPNSSKSQFIVPLSGQCTSYHQISMFCALYHGRLIVSHGIYGIFPGKFAAGKCPVIWKNGAFPGSKFSGEYTVNPVKYGQLPVNLEKICKRTVNWPLIYKMYGHFPVNLRFPVLFLSQLPITGSVKLRVFFLQCDCLINELQLGAFCPQATVSLNSNFAIKNT